MSAIKPSSAKLTAAIDDVAGLRDRINKSRTDYSILEPKVRALLPDVKLPVMGENVTSIDVLDAMHTALIEAECEAAKTEKLERAQLARESNTNIEQPMATTRPGRFVGRLIRRVEAAVA